MSKSSTSLKSIDNLVNEDAAWPLTHSDPSSLIAFINGFLPSFILNSPKAKAAFILTAGSGSFSIASTKGSKYLISGLFEISNAACDLSLYSRSLSNNFSTKSFFFFQNII